MTHRYPTRYQSNLSQRMSEEEVRQESQDDEQQESLFASLIPHEMQTAVESILYDNYDGKISLTNEEKKEAEQLYNIMHDIMTTRMETKFITLHYPIIYRLHATIELFTYMKYNYELVRRFNHLANIFHNYYAHFAVLHSNLWTQCINSSSEPYMDIYLPYCTLLSAIKDIIHTGEMIFIHEGLLKYY